MSTTIKQHKRKGRVVKAHNRKAKTVSWMFGGKKYSGKEIKSKETSTHKYARTENGKIKILPKT